MFDIRVWQTLRQMQKVTVPATRRLLFSIGKCCYFYTIEFSIEHTHNSEVCLLEYISLSQTLILT